MSAIAIKNLVLFRGRTFIYAFKLMIKYIGQAPEPMSLANLTGKCEIRTTMDNDSPLILTLEVNLNTDTNVITLIGDYQDSESVTPDKGFFDVVLTGNGQCKSYMKGEVTFENLPTKVD